MPLRSWFRKPPDPLDERARTLARTLRQRISDNYSEASGKIPALEAVDRDDWTRYATVAAASLTVFPLLRAVKGNATRYEHLVGLVREGLRAVDPRADELWIEAECSTVPPTGKEQAQTLAEVDETQALALARWILMRLVGPERIGQSWDAVRGLSKLLRASVSGYWSAV